MKNTLLAASAVALLAGPLAADTKAPKPKMDANTITLSAKGHSDDQKWVGPLLTFIVFMLAIGGTAAGGGGGGVGGA